MSACVFAILFEETLLLNFTLTALLASNIVARPNSIKLFSYECKLANREPQQN